MKTYTSFEKFFSLLKEYKEEHGHCNIPQRYKVGTIHLGMFVSHIRQGGRKITPEQKAELDAIGFVWDASKKIPFEEVLRLLKEYKKEYGHCYVPLQHKTASGFPLGVVANNIRKGGRKTTPEQKAELDAIGFVWSVRKSSISFEEVFRLLVEYKKEHRHCDVPRTEKVGSVNLGGIVHNIRMGNKTITPEQKAMLDSIGFVWEK